MIRLICCKRGHAAILPLTQSLPGACSAHSANDLLSPSSKIWPHPGVESESRTKGMSAGACASFERPHAMTHGINSELAGACLDARWVTAKEGGIGPPGAIVSRLATG